MKKQVKTSAAPDAPTILSQAVVAGDFVFVAGQVHVTPEGALVSGATSEKVRQIFANIAAILEAAGTSLDSVVKAVVYVTDMDELPQINSVYSSYFSDPLPAREAVCVASLPLGATIEISVTAHK